MLVFSVIVSLLNAVHSLHVATLARCGPPEVSLSTQLERLVSLCLEGDPRITVSSPWIILCCIMLKKSGDRKRSCRSVPDLSSINQCCLGIYTPATAVISLIQSYKGCCIKMNPVQIGCCRGTMLSPLPGEIASQLFLIRGQSLWASHWTGRQYNSVKTWGSMGQKLEGVHWLTVWRHISNRQTQQAWRTCWGAKSKQDIFKWERSALFTPL